MYLLVLNTTALLPLHITSLLPGAYIAQLHPGALEDSHITPPAHDAL